MLTTRGNGKTIQETIVCNNDLSRGKMQREPTLLGQMRRKRMLGIFLTATSRAPMVNQKAAVICYECRKQGHYKSECLKLKNQTV
ncbi:putative reverse transcriptase domain-containing protein [Tanacetum coccineum]